MRPEPFDAPLRGLRRPRGRAAATSRVLLERETGAGLGDAGGQPDASRGSAREDPDRDDRAVPHPAHPRHDGRRGLRRRPGDAGARAHLGSRFAAARERREPRPEGRAPGEHRLARLRRRGERLPEGGRRRAQLPPDRGPRTAALPERRAGAARDGAGRDRRGPRRGRPRRRASAAALARRRREDARRHPRGTPDPRRRGPHPLADRRHRRREADHAGPAAPGRHDAVLHRRRPVDGVGDGERLRDGPAVRRRRRSGGRHDRSHARADSREGRLHRRPGRSRTPAPSRSGSWRRIRTAS